MEEYGDQVHCKDCVLEQPANKYCISQLRYHFVTTEVHHMKFRYYLGEKCKFLQLTIKLCTKTCG